MAKASFFPPSLAPSIGSIVEWTGARPNDEADLSLIIRGVAPIDRAGPGDLTFLDNPRYAAALSQTRASAVLLQPRHSARAPAGCVALSTSEPYRAFEFRPAPRFIRPRAWKPASSSTPAPLSGRERRSAPAPSSAPMR